MRGAGVLPAQSWLVVRDEPTDYQKLFVGQ